MGENQHRKRPTGFAVSAAGSSQTVAGIVAACARVARPVVLTRFSQASIIHYNSSSKCLLYTCS